MIEYRIGKISLALLTDSWIGLSGDSVFAPATRQEWSRALGIEGDGVIPAPVRTLLIGRDGHNTLVDTGFGEERPTDLLEDPHQSPASVGAGTIHRVILTHAHGDHAMGNTVCRGKKWEPAYPEAEYVIQERELAACKSQNKELWETRFEPIADRGRLTVVDGDTVLDDAVSLRLTPGHTIGHQSVVIRSGDRTAVFLGDLAVSALNLERPEWGPDWAWSRAEDEKNRRQLLSWAADNGAALIIGHDARTPIVSARRDGDGFIITAGP